MRMTSGGSLMKEAQKDFDPLDLVYPKEVPGIDKYDQYLPDELLRKNLRRAFWIFKK